MSNFIKVIKEYSSLLKECSVWHNSRDILAPIFTETNEKVASDCYIYEFYCYISLIVDLKGNYEIQFKEGKGAYKYKFPQAAANKAGKPKFIALKHGEIEFQICAGTKIDGTIDSEENHPDISFQKPEASDNPTHDDLIVIMDAKFKENGDILPKAEVYKFGIIVDLFELKGDIKKMIEFSRFKGLESNCLITNGKAYSDITNTSFLKKYAIKEVENFFPGKNFRIIG
ncbi:hypothetical protein [Lacibacter sp. H407]|uniref:hypothetical protein n=1 Tax=Lacibacter sp. H407 TaxID=3133423 RepID=UPI0030C46937